MRRLIVLVVLTFGSTAFAQLPPAKPYATPHAPQPGAANSNEPWAPPKKPTEEQQQREMKEQGQSSGRSGFWTSPYPAKHGAYRYRLLLLGCAIALGMGLLMMRLVRRASPPRPR